MAVLGVATLGNFVLGAGPSSLSDDQVDVAYGLAIEGLPYIWVTDHVGDVLLGSGSNSWIGQYEQDALYTAHETVGQRQVLAGLKMPSRLPKGNLNPKTGQLETTQATFDLVDLDGILPALFASEGKDFDTLGQRVAPGTSALAASVIIDGADTVDPADRYFGIERIGPARERAWFSPFPWQGIGYHHLCNTNSPDDSQGPAPVRVSAEPIDHAGRRVVLWKLYRNTSGVSASIEDWPHWGEQAQLLQPEFVGVMRDAGEYRGDGTWRISCFGIESLSRRRMGTYDMGWTTIASAEVTLTDEQRQIGVAFFGVDDSFSRFDYNSSRFGDAQLSASGDKGSYTDEIGAIIQDVGDGTLMGWGGAAIFDEDFNGSTNVAMAVESNGAIRIRRAGDGDPRLVYCRLCMHERVWRALGYEPALQSVSWAHAPSKETEVVFEDLNEGQQYAKPAGLVGFGFDGTGAPGPGYWVAVIHTATMGVAPQLPPLDDMDNDGAWRRFEPAFSSQPIVLGKPGNEQGIELSAHFPFVEPDLTIDPGGYDAARYWVLRGKRAVGDVTDSGQIFTEEGDLVEDLEAEDFAAVVEFRWNEDSAYGSIDESSGSPSVALYRWISSRRFGVDHDDIGKTGEWAALSGGEYRIEVAPLRAYAYREDPAGDDDGIERAASVFGQLLLSTGTSGGWSGDNFQAGDNAPATDASTFWVSDIVSSELGLGIPYQFVQEPSAILAAFDEVEGGTHGPLNRVRYAYSEPFQSQDMIESLLRPRGLAMSLRGGRFGVTKLGLYEPTLVDAVIDESSVALRSVGDPSSIPTTQQLRATGGLDLVVVEASLDPSTGDYVYEQTVPARDPGSRYRRGDIEEKVAAAGLLNPAWGVGGSSWLGHFRQLHGVERAAWLNQRHFLIRTTLHRISGESLWPGSRVAFSSRRVYTAAGTLGMTNALGHVLSVTARPREQLYDVEILVYAGQTRLSVFAPVGKVASVSGPDVTLVPAAQFLDHEDGEDAPRFDRPSWIESGTGATVCLLEFDRTTWSLLSADSRVVDSVSGLTVTLASGFSNPVHANRDYWLICLGYDDQAADSWPRSAHLPYLLDTHDFGTGPTDGWQYLDG